MRWQKDTSGLTAPRTVKRALPRASLLAALYVPSEDADTVLITPLHPIQITKILVLHRFLLASPCRLCSRSAQPRRTTFGRKVHVGFSCFWP